MPLDAALRAGRRLQAEAPERFRREAAGPLARAAEAPTAGRTPFRWWRKKAAKEQEAAKEKEAAKKKPFWPPPQRWPPLPGEGKFHSASAEQKVLEYQIQREKEFLAHNFGEGQQSELLTLLQKRLEELDDAGTYANENRKFHELDENTRAVAEKLWDKYWVQDDAEWWSPKPNRNTIQKYERPYLYVIYGGALPVPEALKPKFFYEQHS